MLQATTGDLALEEVDLQAERVRISRVLGRDTMLDNQKLIDVMALMEDDLDDGPYADMVKQVENAPDKLAEIVPTFFE